MNNPESLVKSILVHHAAFAKGEAILKRHIESAGKRLEWRKTHDVDMNDSPDIILVIGDSGTGKSFLLQHAAVELRNFHTQEGWIIQAPYVKMPPKPSPITMLERILNEYHAEESQRRSEQYLLHRVTTLIRECETVAVFIDEVQHLVDRRTARAWEHTSDVVKDLSEQTWCLYVLSGLPRSAAVIYQNEQLMTRTRATIELPRFSWEDIRSREQFIGCLKEFHGHINKYARIPAIHEGHWPLRIYCATGGLMRLISNLLIEVLTVSEENRAIGLATFDQAHKMSQLLETNLPRASDPFHKDFMSSPAEQALAAASKIGREIDDVNSLKDSDGRPSAKGNSMRSNPRGAVKKKTGR
jgi:type II secretory pathway predicted ATPase ExeA